MATRVITLLVLLAVTGSFVTATNPPGLRVAITNPGLTELKDIALPIINAAFQDVTLPDMDLQEHVPILGHITLDLTNIKITNFHLPDAAFVVGNPPNLHMALDGLTLEVSIDYRWRKVHWPHISDHGTVTAEPSGGDISLDATIDTSGGHVVLDDTSASASFGGFTIHFSGKVGWLYNLLVGLFKGAIKDAVEKAVTTQLQHGVNDSLNAALAKIKTHQTLGGGKSRVDVNTGVTDILASSSYLSIGDLLSIANNMTGATCPIAPKVLPPVTPGAAGSEMQLLLDDAFLNCISWVAGTNGAFNATLTQATMPKGFPLPLNTTAWGKLIPALAAKYPDRPMTLSMYPKQVPTVATATTGMTATLSQMMDFNVVTASGPTVHVFDLDMALTLGIDVHAKMLNNTPALMLVITTLELQLTAPESTIGPINLGPIQSLFTSFAPLIKDLLNAFLANGFPLPSVDGLELVGPTVEFDPGFLAIATNFTFKA